MIPFAALDETADVILLPEDPSVVAQLVTEWCYAGHTVCVLRGAKMRQVEGLFDETAAALQFPEYFGENWPAFSECLAEMDAVWLPSDRPFIVVVVGADLLLDDEPTPERDALARAIERANSTYRDPIALGEWWDRPAIPFRMVFQVAPAVVHIVRDRWARAGLRVGIT